MKKPKLLRVVDVLIVLGLLALGWRLLPHGRRPKATEPMAPPVRPSSALAAPSVSWAEATLNVVLVVRTTCPASQQSLDFYRQLSQRVRSQAGARLVVLAAEPIDVVRSWLDARGVDVAQIALLRDLAAVGFTVTPTILFVDSAGVVTDVMLRKLSPLQEQSIYRRLASPSASDRLDNTDYVDEIPEASIAQLLASGPATLLDPRDREAYARQHRAGAVNIPSDEIAVRARIELPDSTPVVIDCSGVSVGQCRSSGQAMRRLGFSRVVVAK